MLQEVILTLKKSDDFGGLILLPPKSKNVCEECGHRVSKRLIINKRTGKKVCNNCNNRLGSNPFYSPQKLSHPIDRIGKYKISDEEKQVLGVPKSKKVSEWLDNLKNRKKTQQHRDMGQIRIRDKTNEAFLEGLEQK